MTETDTFAQELQRHRDNVAKANDLNKAVMFDALSAGGITLVLVKFDGVGDSGQIECVAAFRGEEEVDLPDATIALQQVPWGGTEAVAERQTLDQAVVTLCYDFLEETHGGWENNDGAYGEFRFDVAERTIALEFNGRFTDVFTERHTF